MRNHDPMSSAWQCDEYGLVPDRGVLTTTGYGSIVYSDTDPKQRIRFVGDFVDGIRTGSGCISWMDGTHYSGEWYGDRPSGFGMEVYPDGMFISHHPLSHTRMSSRPPALNAHSEPSARNLMPHIYVPHSVKRQGHSHALLNL